MISNPINHQVPRTPVSEPYRSHHHEGDAPPQIPHPLYDAPEPRRPSSPSKLHKAEPPARAPPRAPVHQGSMAPPAAESGMSRLTKARAQSPRSSPRASPSLESRGRGDSLVTPPALNDVSAGRSVSAPVAVESSGNKLSRRSWLPGSKSRNISLDTTPSQLPVSWILSGSSHKIDYNLSSLMTGQKVPELWDDSANMFVYLFPRSSGYGPSFKVPSIILASSQPLLSLIHGDDFAGNSPDSLASLSDTSHYLLVGGGPGTPPYTPQKYGANHMQTYPDHLAESLDSLSDSSSSSSSSSREIHLYFPGILVTPPAEGRPLSPADTQSLLDVRNLFAFLTGKSLVATRERPEVFRIFLAISALLQQFQFTNVDGSTFGEAATASLNFFADDLKLADVSHSREKTLEALILGESMRSMELYTEAFAHAAGRYQSVMAIKSPLYDELSSTTRSRLERAALDLRQRQQSAEIRLTEFEFPSIFAGIGASTSRAEARAVNFKAWKANFLSFRKALLTYYKHTYGQWPPKASSKKNQFEENGLNRLVLKGLYRDMCSLYDLLANRDSMTTRHYDASEDTDEANSDPTITVLRTVLGEYDRSSPPVQPPVPFDVPRIPTMATVDPTYSFLAPKDQHKAGTRKLKGHEMLLILAKSHNLDCDYKTPFLEFYKTFEEKEAKGKHIQDLADQRYGHWLLMYAIMQSLPMLVVDVPGLRFTNGAEYFLCEPPLGGEPWMDESGVKMSWYGVQGGAGVVSLPSDIVVHGVEGIYRRSHCWIVAEQWISQSQTMGPQSPSMEPADSGMFSPLEPPPGFAGGQLGSRPNSRGSRDSRHSSPGRSSQRISLSDDERQSRNRNSKRQSIALGLEQLPIQTTMSSAPSRSQSRGPSPVLLPYGQMRPGSSAGRADSPGKRGSTFDDILGNLEVQDTKKEKRKSFFDLSE